MLRVFLVLANVRQQVTLEQVDRRESSASIVHRLEYPEAAVAARCLDADEDHTVQEPLGEGRHVFGAQPGVEQFAKLTASCAEIPQ